MSDELLANILSKLPPATGKNAGFRRILSFSYDSPGIVWDEDWRGLVFTLLIGSDGRYKVSARLPLKGYDEECVYCVGNVNAERLNQVIGGIDVDDGDWGDWLLPLHVEKRISELLKSLKIPPEIMDRDLDDYNPIYMFNLYEGTEKRLFRFNRNNSEGFEPLIEISDLMRCGRGGVIGELVDGRGGSHQDGDALIQDALFAMGLFVERYQKGEISKDKVCDEYFFWYDEIESAVNDEFIAQKSFDEFRDEVFDMTIDDDIFDINREDP